MLAKTVVLTVSYSKNKSIKSTPDKYDDTTFSRGSRLAVHDEQRLFSPQTTTATSERAKSRSQTSQSYLEERTRWRYNPETKRYHPPSFPVRALDT